ncbi:DUF1761 domain-containing protein [Candidatus Parcubacteria bacterium]|nr:MAG: DUF1761 domain-containing protein [Candidatus Parcubacteria bacterium]
MNARVSNLLLHAIMYEVTLLPVFIAGLVSVVIGFVWYHPRLFGGAWMRMTGITPESVERGKKRMPLMVILALLASMLAAYVLNYFGIAWGVYDIIGAFELGFWSWVGFVAPVMFGIVLWEQKPFALYLINALYWLVALIAMSIVLVL